MRQQLRPRVIIPVAVLGLLGAGFGAFAMGGPATPDTLPLQHATSSGAVDTGAVDTGAVDTGAVETTPAPTTTEPAPTPAPPKPKPEPKTPLEQEQAQHKVVVVVFQTPGADLDAATVRESRAGAAATDAGFLAVDVTNDSSVADLAAEYEVLEAPTVLVLVGDNVQQRFDGYVDRETVAQAVTNARK
jgi:hypothetical protein